MENAEKHWKVLQLLRTELANRVRSFIVVGKDGDGVIVVTEDGDGFRLGSMWFELNIFKVRCSPTSLNVPGLVQMAHGHRHILLLNKRGKIYAMGANDRGQQGMGKIDRISHFSPKLIPIPHKFTLVRCGREHSVALTDDGKVWAWGANDHSQVGVPSSTDSILSPRQIAELVPYRVVAVECGGYHSLALTDQGEVYAWGKNDYGQLGNGSESSTLAQIPTPSPVKSMAAGSSHTLLLAINGEVYAFGENRQGQLGFPNSTVLRPHLSSVAGLPPISQIASHPLTNLSVAMSSDQRCFVWGELRDETSISTPRKLPSNYSTVESLLSSFSTYRSTPYSVFVPAKECPRGTDSTSQTEPWADFAQTLPANNRLLDRIGKMFDNPDSSPDVRFQVGDQSIMAHRNVLQISSGHFNRLFSFRSANFNPTSSVSSTSQSGPSCSQHATNPSESDKNSTITTPQVTISDHSYPAFHAYLRFLYQGILEVGPEHLTDLFSLSVDYLESDLQQLCLSRMRSTLTSATCCLFYQYTLRYPMPKLNAFQQELVKFISANFLEVIATASYQSMDAELCKKLTLSVVKHSP